MRRLVQAVLLSTCVIALTAPRAGAAFPGVNGKIVYDQLSPSPPQIHSVDADGSNIATLTARGANTSPDWSADGTKIAFVHYPANGRTPSLMEMSATGSTKTTILSSFPAGFRTPAGVSWSPGGTQLAFCAYGRQGNAVFTVNVNGTGRTNISGTHQDCDPEWSPDGTKIVVDTSTRRGATYIASMNPDGTGRSRITAGFQPDWSPDGSTIVFVSFAKQTDIATIGADGAGRALLTHSSRRWEFSPAYSPDGSEIVYSRTQSRSFASPDDLWTIHTDGSSPTQITNTTRRDEFDADWGPA